MALSFYLGELPEVVQRSKCIKLLKGQDQSLVRRWAHVVKVNEVVDA